MPFENIMMKVRQVLLCNKEQKQKPSLDIGSPTNVRYVHASDAIPGLTSSERAYIREKASSDAMHLLSLRSHPPSSTPSQPPTPTQTSPPLSRSPSSSPLPNAASANLPLLLPTPPRHTHAEHSPPATRMKSMSTWEDALPSTALPVRALSFGESESSVETNGSALLQHVSEKKGLSERYMTLNLDFEKWGAKDDGNTTPPTLSLEEGFEGVEVVGGDGQVVLGGVKGGRDVMKGTDDCVSGASESGSEGGEKRPLVKI